MLSKKLGVIVGVDGDISQVGMYSMSNDAEFIWNGEVLSGVKVGAFLTINQNDIKIIATIATEKITDQQNSVKSTEFDNRYRKDSINRIITLKTKGIIANDKFQVTSKYVPMIGNEVTLTTKDDLEIIYGVDSLEPTISIGESILEGQPIKLSINKIFASHIGVFGNTGSGKSNTLHKLYLELFRSEYYDKIIEKSKFYIIDFNGEYMSDDHFGVKPEHKKRIEINTRNSANSDKLSIAKDYLFEPDILAILFDATPATQVPFLRSALKTFNEKINDEKDFAVLEIGLLRSLIEKPKDCNPEPLKMWTEISKKLGVDNKLIGNLENISMNLDYGNMKVEERGSGTIIMEKGGLTIAGERLLRLDEIEKSLQEEFLNKTPIMQLYFFLEFQKLYVSAWKSTNIEHINPLFKRIETAFNSLEKVVNVVDRTEINKHYNPVNIISLVHANKEITRLIPMLLSKMVYDQQKTDAANNKVNKTTHLIIDEAHNILNAEYRNNGDDWQDYRLSVFEEIVKEGRKFGFYLTLSSQRPADISPTILSQAHNYFIHRLVNDKDLRMLENTMPTLDRSSYQRIPCLGQGEVVITGNTMQVPVFVKVKKETSVRPNSDDIILTELWAN